MAGKVIIPAIIDENDRESDVLDSDYEYESPEEVSSDSDDSSLSESSEDDDDDINSNSQSVVDPDYLRFVQSVFCDEDDVISMTNSLLGDNDDDGEYRPDDALANDNEEEADDLDNDFLYVPKREVQDLVDGVWETIVGENDKNIIPTVDESSVTNASNTNDDTGNINENNGQSPYKLNNSYSQSHRNKRRNNGFVFNSGSPSLISRAVNQLNSSGKSSDINIEGLPIDGIRKLAARQISMANQLLLQMLLISDDKSSCFSKNFNNLMELSNYRDKAIKKAVLLDLNLENVRSYRHAIEKNREKKSLKYRNIAKERRELHSAASALQSFVSKKPMSGIDIDEDILDDESCDYSTSEISNSDEENNNQLDSRRITRSSIAQLDIKSKTNRSMSTMDSPFLSRMKYLFEQIDYHRTELKSAQCSSSTSSSSSSLSERFRQKLADDDNKVQLLVKISDASKDILTKLGMRYWECLSLKKDYPLPYDTWKGFDNNTLNARCYFTPTEDELLLRGLVMSITSLDINKNIAATDSIPVREPIQNRGKVPANAEEFDYQWSLIHSKLLPSKEAQALKYRFSQLTSMPITSSSGISTSTVNQRFVNLLKLQKAYLLEREQSMKANALRWSLKDDQQLVKGFQVHGSKWHLVNLFFLPHKQIKDIKQRWPILLRQYKQQTTNDVFDTENAGFYYDHGATGDNKLEDIEEDVLSNDENEISENIENDEDFRPIKRSKLNDKPGISSPKRQTSSNQSSTENSNSGHYQASSAVGVQGHEDGEDFSSFTNITQLISKVLEEERGRQSNRVVEAENNGLFASVMAAATRKS